jgi:large subunit ribosomal protein L29
MKASELRQKSEQELKSMLDELSREQFNLRMQKGSGQLSRPDQVKKARRDIARIHTLLKEMASAS